LGKLIVNIHLIILPSAGFGLNRTGFGVLIVDVVVGCIVVVVGSLQFKSDS